MSMVSEVKNAVMIIINLAKWFQMRQLKKKKEQELNTAFVNKAKDLSDILKGDQRLGNWSCCVHSFSCHHCLFLCE